MNNKKNSRKRKPYTWAHFKRSQAYFVLQIIGDCIGAISLGAFMIAFYFLLVLFIP